MLSGAGVQRSETPAESKHPYTAATAEIWILAAILDRMSF
jgi:hypothetical protein